MTCMVVGIRRVSNMILGILGTCSFKNIQMMIIAAIAKQKKPRSQPSTTLSTRMNQADVAPVSHRLTCSTLWARVTGRLEAEWAAGADDSAIWGSPQALSSLLCSPQSRRGDFVPVYQEKQGHFWNLSQRSKEDIAHKPPGNMPLTVSLASVGSHVYTQPNHRWGRWESLWAEMSWGGSASLRLTGWTREQDIPEWTVQGPHGNEETGRGCWAGCQQYPTLHCHKGVSICSGPSLSTFHVCAGINWLEFQMNLT